LLISHDTALDASHRRLGQWVGRHVSSALHDEYFSRCAHKSATMKLPLPVLALKRRVTALIYCRSLCNGGRTGETCRQMLVAGRLLGRSERCRYFSDSPCVPRYPEYRNCSALTLSTALGHGRSQAILFGVRGDLAGHAVVFYIGPLRNQYIEACRSYAGDLAPGFEALYCFCEESSHSNALKRDEDVTILSIYPR